MGYADDAVAIKGVGCEVEGNLKGIQLRSAHQPCYQPGANVGADDMPIAMIVDAAGVAAALADGG